LPDNVKTKNKLSSFITEEFAVGLWGWNSNKQSNTR